MTMTWLKNLKIALLLCCTIPAQAQMVWPGDVNNNGIVNGVDLLWLGLAYDANGPIRPGASTGWTPQLLGMPWEQSFFCGLNYAYADADGDGDVDEKDLEEALLPNFRQIHGTFTPDGYANAEPGGKNPAITLLPSATEVLPGEALTIKVILGDEILPTTNFYGIALKMHYSSGLVNNNGADISFTTQTSWIDPENEGIVKDLYYKDSVSGDVEVAIVRSNQIPVDGHGSIGSFSIIIEDIIVGIAPQFELRIDSVMLIDQNDTITAVVADTVFVNIKQKVRGRGIEPDGRMKISPNPTGPDATAWRLESTEPLHHLELIDGLGRAFPVSPQPAGEFLWLVPKPANLPPGAYWLSGYTEKGVLITHLIQVF
ncbi:MAG: hypothetical protein IT270_19865 [Saprospiraceae bacterium]|nr:hypothetical protein [Saprospiraceae bacterium]